VVSQVNSPASIGVPFRLVTVKMKLVWQVDVTVDVTFASKKVCTFAAESISYVYGLAVRVEGSIVKLASEQGS